MSKEMRRIVICFILLLIIILPILIINKTNNIPKKPKLNSDGTLMDNPDLKDDKGNNGLSRQVDNSNALAENRNVIVKKKNAKVKSKSEIGNANYYNSKDGNYYADKNFKTKANDNTSYLLKLLSTGGVIQLPEGNYLCRKQIRLKGKNIRIYGDKSKTKIIFDGTNFIDHSKDLDANSVMVNAKYNRSYDERTAQSIGFYNIIFEYKRINEKSPNTILLLANVNGVYVEECRFIADIENKVNVTLVDLYSCCKNVNIKNCTFVNMTNASNGGSIWVRNLTRETEKVDNVTENIIIDNSSFSQNTGDETIAVFSCIGHIRNVKVKNCELFDNSPINVMVLSVYPSVNKYYGTVKNVTFDNNKIISSDIKNYIITIGGSNRKNKVSNVTISNCTINILNNNWGSINSMIIFVSRTGTSIDNVVISKNIINANQVPNTIPVCYANHIDGNTIVGQFKYGIIKGKVYKNIIMGSEKGIVDPDIAEGNEISGCKIGISCNLNETIVKKNRITLNRDDALCAIEILDKKINDNYKITCIENEINTTNEKQYSYIIHSGNVDLISNTIKGLSEKIYIGENANVIQKQ